MADTESAIIERVCSGDIERFSELVSRHQDQVYGVLRRLVPDPETAEDLAQTAFLKAFEGLSSFRQASSFATWVTQIAIHLARDDHRRRRRAEVIPFGEAGESLTESGETRLVDSSASPLDDMIAADLQERLTRAIATLPADYREVFVLRHIEENSYEEIASLTGVSEGALKVRNHRARKILLECLREEDEPPVLRLHRR